MKKIDILTFLSVIVVSQITFSQTISDFVSVNPLAQSEQFVIPATHRFQKIIAEGEPLTEGVGEVFPIRPDFTGYVPIDGSNTNGYLSINSEAPIGGVTVLDINFNSTSNLWETTLSQKVDMSPVFGTRANCSGTVTPWNTIISCEEVSLAIDLNGDLYYDNGWNVEVDPATKTVLGKRWAMGNFAHENVVIHANERTVYQGADSNPGYLYKFVADTAQDLTSGLLYVYTGSKSGPGNWVLLQNSTPNERNTTIAQSGSAGGTVFSGVEDVEIGPDGLVYFAVKGEGQVYRFQDSDPITGTTATMETFVGNMSYDIVHESGTTSKAWGNGNDNLAFDGTGNLWVFQDGDSNYIWVVESGHTQVIPKVKVFGIAPTGAEPTGITFTPDYKYLFMSIQHPTNTNNAEQTDAAGTIVDFDLETVLVVALESDLGDTLSLNEVSIDDLKAFPNPVKVGTELVLKGKTISNVKLYSMSGDLILNKDYMETNRAYLNFHNLNTGLYLLKVNDKQVIKISIY